MIQIPGWFTWCLGIRFRAHDQSTPAALRGHHRPGFTLIELLVTLSMVFVLIALIAPSVRSSRESARKLKCGVQLRSLGVAVIGFANDYDYFPLAARIANVAAGTLHLPNELAPYLGGQTGLSQDRFVAPWACPSDREDASGGQSRYGYLPAWDLNAPSEAWDEYLVPTSRDVSRITLLEYETQPSVFVLLSDVRRYHGVPTVHLPADSQWVHVDGHVSNVPF